MASASHGLENDQYMARVCSERPGADIYRTFLTDTLYLPETDKSAFKQLVNRGAAMLVALTKPLDGFIER